MEHGLNAYAAHCIPNANFRDIFFSTQISRRVAWAHILRRIKLNLIPTVLIILTVFALYEKEVECRAQYKI